MSLEELIWRKYHEYFHELGVAPKTLSLSYQTYYREFHQTLALHDWIGLGCHRGQEFRGMKIKWVQKKGHIQCLPRPKKYLTYAETSASMNV